MQVSLPCSASRPVLQHGWHGSTIRALERATRLHTARHRLPAVPRRQSAAAWLRHCQCRRGTMPEPSQAQVLGAAALRLLIGSRACNSGAAWWHASHACRRCQVCRSVSASSGSGNGGSSSGGGDGSGGGGGSSGSSASGGAAAALAAAPALGGKEDVILLDVTGECGSGWM